MRRLTIARVLGGTAIAVAGLLPWPALSDAQAPTPGPQDPSRGDAGRLYEAGCAACHGHRGDGRGRAAPLLGRPRPRDFRAGVFEFRSTPTGSLPTDADLYRTISRGVPGTWMPAWEGLLTPAQRWALVRYLKGFSAAFAEEEPEFPVPVPTPPETNPDLVAEGRMVYALLGCARCHGARGRGDGPSAHGLTDDWGRRIRPYDFTVGRYKNGSAPEDLYRTLVTGLNGTPMPAFEADLAAFPGGAEADVGPLADALDPEALRDLRAYLTSQPSAARIGTMTRAEREALAQRRLWALVHYLRSLNRPKGALRWLFGDNPGAGPKRAGR